MTPTELEKLKQAQHQPDLSGLAVSGIGFAHGKNMSLLDDVVLDDAGNPVIHSKDQLEFALDHKFGKFVTRGEANDVCGHFSMTNGFRKMRPRHTMPSWGWRP